MNLEHLKAFYVAAEKRNFSETAKSLHLSQPTVSLYIQQLESTLESKLFDRTTKQIKLTDEGKIVYEYTEQILNLVNKLKKELHILGESTHGSLHIGASLTIGEYILPYILGSFSKEYPKIELLMRTYNSNQIIQQLEDEDIHIGFIEAPIFHPSFFHQPFMSDELVVVSSATHPHSLIGQRDTITSDDLFSLPIILREPGSGTRSVLEDKLRENNLDPRDLNVVLELGNTESIKAVVETGLGVSIISESALHKELHLGTLKKIKIKGINLQRSFYLVYNKNKILPTVTEAFIQYLFKNLDYLSAKLLDRKTMPCN